MHGSIFKFKKIFRSKNYWFLGEVELPVDGILEYIKMTDKTISRINASIEKHEKSLEGSSIEKMKSAKLFDYYAKKSAHQLYYHSIFITEYSFLEKKMLQLLKIAEVKKTLKISDVAGKDIFKYYLYLEKVLNVDVSNVKMEWEKIIKYNQLRNLLVHHPTSTIEVQSLNDNRLKILKSINHLKIEQQGNLFEFEISDKRLLIDFAETIREFLVGIFFED